MSDKVELNQGGFTVSDNTGNLINPNSLNGVSNPFAQNPFYRPVVNDTNITTELTNESELKEIKEHVDKRIDKLEKRIEKKLEELCSAVYQACTPLLQEGHVNKSTIAEDDEDEID